jgi:hypothetical protein
MNAAPPTSPGTLVAGPERRTGRTASRRRARLIGVLAALAMTAGLLTSTAAPAAAATSYGPLCNYIVGDFNACITINYAGGGLWNVGLGQDDYMSVAQADRIIAHGSSMFATLLGERSGRFLGYVPLVAGSPVSGTNPEGLFADFYGTNIDLNEFSGQDKVVAEITYFDIDSNTWITHRTGEVVGSL